MDNLEKLTYKELRKIAKRLGMKAKGKAGKLIKEIRNYNEENKASIERKPTISTSSTLSSSRLSSSTDDDEIVFSFNPVSEAADVDEVPEQNMDNGDDEIVFGTTPTENGDAKQEFNKSAELENIEDQLSESNQHDETVEFEEHTVLKSELVDEVTDQLNTTFEIETENKNEGDSTMNKDEEEESHVKKENSADNVQDLLEVMRPEMTDDEMKAALMAAIDKKVKNKKVTIMSPNVPSEFVSHIPTFSITAQKSHANKEKATLKGKDWQKIHEKLFSKQDSLDVYLAKKTKRMRRMNTPMKSVKPIKEESQVMGEKLKKETKSATKSSVTKPSNRSFIPKIVSTKSMSLQFATTSSTVSAVTESNCSPSQNQQNKMIKSAKKSPRKSLPDSAKKLMKHSHVKMSSAKQPFSPYNFGNTLSQSPNSMKKAKFDLQASLAKPITWKRHTGKLKPIAFGDVEPQYFKKGLNASIQTNRENRRAVTAQSRANKRNNLLNSRRNIN